MRSTVDIAVGLFAFASVVVAVSEVCSNPNGFAMIENMVAGAITFANTHSVTSSTLVVMTKTAIPIYDFLNGNVHILNGTKLPSRLVLLSARASVLATRLLVEVGKSVGVETTSKAMLARQTGVIPPVEATILAPRGKTAAANTHFPCTKILLTQPISRILMLGLLPRAIFDRLVIPMTQVGLPRVFLSSRKKMLTSSEERVVPFIKENSDSMDLSRCKSRCASLGYAWMMVENGYSCFCGGALRNDARLASAGDCNMPCAGEDSECCGGSWAGIVYYNEDLDSMEPCGAPMTPE
ncbi:hypothetical protein TWF506_002116 [Arthrobotrys conoides]|uniref:WSC domain-containing protein n=1 Tax=Arthrobotrys conoides TaxID=74498 RepID=A0AAN8NYK3_9PEZI